MSFSALSDTTLQCMVGSKQYQLMQLLLDVIRILGKKAAITQFPGVFFGALSELMQFFLLCLLKQTECKRNYFRSIIIMPLQRTQQELWNVTHDIFHTTDLAPTTRSSRSFKDGLFTRSPASSITEDLQQHEQYFLRSFKACNTFSQCFQIRLKILWHE